MISYNKNNKVAVIILAVIVIISFVSIICFNTKDGGYAFIYQDGNLLEVIELENDTTYQVLNNNEITNIIAIENGYAYMKEANCKDHTCIHMGKIKHNNQSIVCLPNKVIITIQNNDNINYDSVVQ